MCIRTLHQSWLIGRRSHSIRRDRSMADENENAARNRDGRLDETNAEEKQDKRGLGRQIVDFLLPRVQLFHTADGKGYICYRIKDHRENHAIDSKPVRMWVTDIARRQFKSPPSRAVVDTVTAALEAAAITGGTEQKVYYRIARVGDEIYIDLGDRTWDALKVTSAGWQVVSEPQVRFVRHRNMDVLPHPSKTPNLKALQRFLNVASEEDFRLIVAWIIAAMTGAGPYAILLILGPQGSAKSAMASILRRIIDPVLRASSRSLWRNEWDLAIAASRNAVLAFDNISKLTAEQSDAACRLATGSGFATRELWSRDEETVFDGMRPLIFNGIAEFATRADFLERALVVVLPTISPIHRRSMKKVTAEFEAEWPHIFSGLLDALAAALKNLSSVSTPELPRMADFALTAIAAEPACPWQPGEFLRAYHANLRQGHDIALEADPFALAMIEFGQGLRWRSDKRWSGTATELREQLMTTAINMKDLPSTASALSTELRRLEPVLVTRGVEITFDRRGAGGTRLITVTWKSDRAPEMAVESTADAADGSDGNSPMYLLIQEKITKEKITKECEMPSRAPLASGRTDDPATAKRIESTNRSAIDLNAGETSASA